MPGCSEEIRGSAFRTPVRRKSCFRARHKSVLSRTTHRLHIAIPDIRWSGGPLRWSCLYSLSATLTGILSGRSSNRQRKETTGLHVNSFLLPDWTGGSDTGNRRYGCKRQPKKRPAGYFPGRHIGGNGSGPHCNPAVWNSCNLSYNKPEHTCPYCAGAYCSDTCDSPISRFHILPCGSRIRHARNRRRCGLPYYKNRAGLPGWTN